MTMSKKRIGVYGSKDFVKFYNTLEFTNELKRHIEQAVDLLADNPIAGNRIEKHLWPKKYIRKYGINNLFRYQLPSGYRMIYTLIGESKEIICLIIAVLSHKEYDETFGY